MMLRLYLRLVLNKIQKIRFFIKDYKNWHHNFMKPAIYKGKINKVIKINKSKLSKKQEIIDQVNGQNSKNINYIQ